MPGGRKGRARCVGVMVPKGGSTPCTAVAQRIPKVRATVMEEPKGGKEKPNGKGKGGKGKTRTSPGFDKAMSGR